MASSFSLLFLLSVTSGLFIAETMAQAEPGYSHVCGTNGCVTPNVPLQHRRFLQSARFQGPACPPEWTQFGSRCFLFNHMYKRWIDAEAACIALGGNLASVHSAEENAFLRDYIQRMAGYRAHAWVGATDAVQEGIWRWSDGSPFDYKRWSVGEPNNYYSEHCAEMNWGGNYWNDSRCYWHKFFVCSRDVSQ